MPPCVVAHSYAPSRPSGFPPIYTIKPEPGLIIFGVLTCASRKIKFAKMRALSFERVKASHPNPSCRAAMKISRETACGRFT